jgi:RNase P subunit RPR2
MTTDYFEFVCKKCCVIIPQSEFFGIDSIGVRLRVKCDKCGEESIFKLKTTPPLGPIEMIDSTYNKTKRGYKLYDGRKIRKHLKNIGNPLYLNKEKH